MIIAVHLPKTAGFSFREGLKEAYDDRILFDYDDKPLSDFFIHKMRRKKARSRILAKKNFLKNNFDVICGHFIADKYEPLGNDTRYCMFFRDPVDRVCSHYFHLKRKLKFDNSMRVKLHLKQLTIPEFSKLNKQSNIYEFFLGNLSVEDLYFVGITERYSDSISLYEKMFGKRLTVKKENIGKIRDYKALLKDKGLLDEISESQNKNRRIYDIARKKFDSLCKRYL